MSKFRNIVEKQNLTRRDFLLLLVAIGIGVTAYSPTMFLFKKLEWFGTADSLMYGTGAYGYSSY